MLSRIPFGVVPAWELALSIAVLFITFVIVTYLAGKIYHVGILMYGKKASFKDLYKWIKQTK
jgi:ABC-2 type transport system permease protein